MGQPGDNLTPHHMPQNALMNKEGVKTQDGICMMMEHPYPGTGGRHRQTETYGKVPKADENIDMRTELAKDIKDAREIYKKDDLYTPEIREGLQEVIKKNLKILTNMFR